MGKVKMNSLQAKAFKILYFNDQQIRELSLKKYNQPVLGKSSVKQKIETFLQNSKFLNCQAFLNDDDLFFD